MCAANRLDIRFDPGCSPANRHTGRRTHSPEILLLGAITLFLQIAIDSNPSRRRESCAERAGISKKGTSSRPASASGVPSTSPRRPRWEVRRRFRRVRFRARSLSRATTYITSAASVCSIISSFSSPRIKVSTGTSRNTLAIWLPPLWCLSQRIQLETLRRSSQLRGPRQDVQQFLAKRRIRHQADCDCSNRSHFSRSFQLRRSLRIFAPIGMNAALASPAGSQDTVSRGTVKIFCAAARQSFRRTQSCSAPRSRRISAQLPLRLMEHHGNARASAMKGRQHGEREKWSLRDDATERRVLNEHPFAAPGCAFAREPPQCPDSAILKPWHSLLLQLDSPRLSALPAQKCAVVFHAVGGCIPPAKDSIYMILVSAIGDDAVVAAFQLYCEESAPRIRCKEHPSAARPVA